MASASAGSIKRAVASAARLHMALGTQVNLTAYPGPVDVFDTIVRLGIPLLIRPLDGLLGAFVREPVPGILVTSKRQLSVQRFTAAHELGHFYMEHVFSLDEPGLLARSPFEKGINELQELEANVFAASFLMPRWLVGKASARHGWRAPEFGSPAIVYQLSLRLGTSYSATIYTLQRYNFISPATAKSHLSVSVKSLKEALLREFRPSNYFGDVWLLTERDEGTVIAGSRNDHFVLKLKEHSASGYLWNIKQLQESGFVVVQDCYEGEPVAEVGGLTERLITTRLHDEGRGRLQVFEERPWAPGAAINALTLSYDLTGPEQEGFSRAERRRRLQAA